MADGYVPEPYVPTGGHHPRDRVRRGGSMSDRTVTARCDRCGRFAAEPLTMTPIRDAVHPYVADWRIECKRHEEADDDR